MSARDLPLDEALASFLVQAGGDDPLHPEAALEAARTFIEYHGLVRSRPADRLTALEVVESPFVPRGKVFVHPKELDVPDEIRSLSTAIGGGR